jgi:hypothetical protein
LVSFHGNKKLEGFIVERVNDVKVKVDFGEAGIRECLVDNCTLVSRSYEFEVGDKVQAKMAGSFLFFVGTVVKIDYDQKTIDVLMDGDDPDDIELDVNFSDARKLMTRRALVQSRWRKTFMVIQASRFFSMGSKNT